jgi:serine/threonine-protein kinase
MDVGTERDTAARVIGRYVLFREVAHGGMATVHLGRLRSVGGFARTVAIKRLHPPFARDPEFVSMFLDEARVAARIQHPNVVSVLDVVASEGELFLVMEYVHGEGLSKLTRHATAQGIGTPQKIAAGILVDVLYGLHAAHEARNERGDPLNVVHRDVSPQNVLVGVDGAARVLDFGIAKAAQCAHAATRAGQLKGKLGYMAPEQVATGPVDRRADVYAAGVTLWEALTGQRMFPQLEIPHLIAEILTREHVPPSRIAPGTSPELDAVVMRALERDPSDRYATAADMAADLERATPIASRREIGEWVECVADGSLRRRAASISEIETATFAEIAQRGAAGPFKSEPPASAEPIAGGADIRVDIPGDIPVDIAVNEIETADVEPAEDEWNASLSPALARGRPRGLLAVAALAVCIVVAIAVRGRWFASPQVASRAAPAAVADTAVRAAATALPAAPATDSPPPAPTPHVVASPYPAGAPAPTEAVETPVASVRPSRTAAPTARAASGRPAQRERPPEDCTPPYTVDALGVRIPKRWCS